MKWALAASALVLLVTLAGVGLWLHTRPPPSETWGVTYTQPGTRADELQRQLSPAEHALRSMPGVRALRETCTEGRVEFHVETAPEADLRGALSPVQAALPDDLLPPIVTRAWPDLVEERFVVTSDTLPRAELSRWARDAFEGMGSVEWCGLVRDEVRVKLDLRSARAFGQRPEDIASALAAAKTFEDASAAVRDVATVSREASTPECLALQDGRPVLVATLRHPRERALTLPALPASVTLTPLSAPLEEWLMADAEAPRLPGLVLQRGHRLTAFTALDAPPGLALLRKAKGVAIQVLGPPELAKATAVKLREALANEPGWTGAVPDLMVPVTQLKADRADATRLVALLMNGHAGQLSNGTPIVLEAGDDLLDATLADGTPLSLHVTKQLTQEPESLLRVDGQPAIEFFTSIENPQRVLNAQPLPPGVQVRVAR